MVSVQPTQVSAISIVAAAAAVAASSCRRVAFPQSQSRTITLNMSYKDTLSRSITLNMSYKRHTIYDTDGVIV